LCIGIQKKKDYLFIYLFTKAFDFSHMQIGVQHKISMSLIANFLWDVLDELQYLIFLVRDVTMVALWL
jgi:hypothetical protein